jgi:hypothetical protein
METGCEVLCRFYVISYRQLLRSVESVAASAASCFVADFGAIHGCPASFDCLRFVYELNRRCRKLSFSTAL